MWGHYNIIHLPGTAIISYHLNYVYITLLFSPLVAVSGETHNILQVPLDLHECCVLEEVA